MPSLLPPLLLLLLLPISSSYTLSNASWDSPTAFSATLSDPTPNNPYGTNLDLLDFSFELLADDTARVRVTDPGSSRWEIPESVLSSTASGAKSVASPALSFSYTEEPFTFSVTRTSDSAVLFSSSPELHYSPGYLSISTSLPVDAALFGLGESSTTPGAAIPKGTTHTMWARDMAAAEFDTNL
jgi:alpha-glucosidase (family GH31 glycosyl hydrolase)